MRRHPLALGGSTVLVAALAAGAAEPPRGAIVSRVECAAAPGQSYALYLPAAYTRERSWPILYCFDARQRGTVPAERFRSAAEALGYIIAASNNSRSDESMEPNIEAMKAMWEDTHARFAIDPRRVYASGFSGGARAASLLAISRPGEVAGVIGCGGGFPFNLPPTQATRFAFFGTAGRNDFNYSELRALDDRLGTLGLAHRFETFFGGHEWAPPDLAAEALSWMDLLATRQGTIPRRESFLEAEYTNNLAGARRLEGEGDPVAAARRYEGMRTWFAGLHDLGQVDAELARLSASAGYATELATQRKAEEDAGSFLAQAQTTLRRALQDPGAVALPRLLAEMRVPELQKRARTGAGRYAGFAAQRVLETLYVQTSFYIPRELLAKKQYEQAEICLELASAIKPEDPWVWYSLAACRAQAGQGRRAYAALRRAIEGGWSDADRLESDPNFSRLRKEKAFREILDRLRAHLRAEPHA